MKLALGTANFGNKYSILKKKVSFKEIKKIEKIVKKSNISLLDTADSYKNNTKILSKTKLKNLNIVTKIKFNKELYKNNKIILQKKIHLFLKKLKVNKIHAVLIHDYKDIIGKNGKLNIELLLNLKKKKIVNKVGISIYDPKELKKIWKIWRPDLVQAPLNVFDHRIHKSGWLNKLKRNKVEVHVRSCFLQGILLNYEPKNKFYNKFKKWEKLFYNWSSWCETHKISKLEACLNFIKNFKNIDYLIIGIEKPKQLSDIIRIFRSKKKNIPYIFECKDKKLIEPKNWK